MLQLSHNDGFPLFVEPAERGASTLPHFSYNTNPGNRGFRRVLLFLLPALTFLSGCWSANTREPTARISPELRPYVDLFLREAEKYRDADFRMKLEGILRNHISSIVISERVPSVWYGVCYFPIPEIGRKGRIEIFPDFASNKMVIFHELTHCLLNLDHSPLIPFFGGEATLSYLRNNYISPYELNLVFTRNPAIPRLSLGEMESLFE